MNLRRLFRRERVDLPGWPNSLAPGILAVRMPASWYSGPPPIGFREVLPPSLPGTRQFERIPVARCVAVVSERRVGSREEVRAMPFEEWQRRAAKVLGEARR